MLVYVSVGEERVGQGMGLLSVILSPKIATCGIYRLRIYTEDHKNDAVYI